MPATNEQHTNRSFGADYLAELAGLRTEYEAVGRNTRTLQPSDLARPEQHPDGGANQEATPQASSQATPQIAVPQIKQAQEAKTVASSQTSAPAPKRVFSFSKNRQATSSPQTPQVQQPQSQKPQPQSQKQSQDSAPRFSFSKAAQNQKAGSDAQAAKQVATPFGARNAETRSAGQGEAKPSPQAATVPAPARSTAPIRPSFSFSSRLAASKKSQDEMKSASPAPVKASPATAQEDPAPAAATPAPATSSPAPAAASPASAPPRFSFGNRSGASPEQMALLAKPDELVGTLNGLRMYNSDWGIAKVLTDDGERFSVKGAALANLVEGQRYRFEGKKSEHPRYGLQFEVSVARPDMDSIHAIVNHLQKNFKGVGPALALKIARHHKSEGTLDKLKEALIYAPEDVDFSPFTNSEVTLINDSSSETRRIQDMLSIRFSGTGLGDGVMGGLAAYLLIELEKPENKELLESFSKVAAASRLLDDNPYLPVGSVDRYGFRTADLIARNVGIAQDDPRRLVAMVSYALDTACTAMGHAYIDEANLLSAIKDIDYSVNPKQALELAIEDAKSNKEKGRVRGGLVVDEGLNGTRYYPEKLYRAEKWLGSYLGDKIATEVDPIFTGTEDELRDIVDEAVGVLAYEKGIEDYELDESQRAAVEGILTSRCSFHTITAGPGCGKTAIIEVLMEAISIIKDTETETPRPDMNPVFAAPTGKAAKVLNSRIKPWGEAKTIHSLLAGNQDEEQINTRLAVIDETSMLSTTLAHQLLRSIPGNAHVILLGDPGQLASIDPGNVLANVLNIEGLDHHRLTKTHRNAGDLLKVINEVGKGRCPTVSSEGVKFLRELPEPAPSAFIRLAAEVKDAAKKYGSLSRVGVICPRRKGDRKTPDWNVTYLNEMLRDAINPDDAAGSKKISGTSLRYGDRVLITKNMKVAFATEADRGVVRRTDEAIKQRNDDAKQHVVNGDTGEIAGVIYDEDKPYDRLLALTLKLDDDRLVMFHASEIENLSLSYAITVHAAQGSEYDKVFGIVTDGHERFMFRNMIFTQFSRAKHELDVYGDPEALTRVAQRAAPKRNCALIERTLDAAAKIMSYNEKVENEDEEKLQADSANALSAPALPVARPRMRA